MSVGLLVARLKYGLYVGHLSKWFVFVLMFKVWSSGRLVNGLPTIGYNGCVYETLGIAGDLLSSYTKVDAWKNA